MTGWRGLLAAALLAASPAAAAESGEPAEDGAASLARAEAALSAAERSQDDVAAFTAAVLAYEAALVALRADVMEAAQRERTLRLGMAAQREQVTRLLAALQAASRMPPPTTGLHPQGPLAAARAAAMVAQLRPALGVEAAELTAALAEIAAARADHRQGLDAIGEGLAGLDAAREALRTALAAGPERPAADAATVALVRGSDTLTELAAALAGGEAARSAEPPAGRLAWPVAGQVLLGYGARDAAGERRPGVVIAAPPRALVTAPADGVVRYAGPFLDYGYVVVLAPEAGTLVVLAGLAELHVGGGAKVRRGDPLGLLGGRTPSAEQYLMLTEAGTGAGAEETLYVEIRHGAGPVDPEPWFTDGSG